MNLIFKKDLLLYIIILLLLILLCLFLMCLGILPAVIHMYHCIQGLQRSQGYDGVGSGNPGLVQVESTKCSLPLSPYVVNQASCLLPVWSKGRNKRTGKGSVAESLPATPKARPCVPRGGSDMRSHGA